MATTKLSAAMIDSLRHSVLDANGRITCYAWHKGTLGALVRRGGQAMRFGRQVELDFGLAIAAVRAYEESDRSAAAEWVEREVQAYGHVGSGYADFVTAECWQQVREGRMRAQRDEVVGWGSTVPGWKFTRVEQAA